MVKKILALLFVGLNALFGWYDMCDIPDDIKARYEDRIKYMKDNDYSGKSILEFKKQTLGVAEPNGDFGRDSYWNSDEYKNSNNKKYIEACEKKEKYYRKAYELQMQGKNNTSHSCSLTKIYNDEAESCIRLLVYDLEIKDNL